MTDTATLFDFDNTYASALSELAIEWTPDRVPTPELVAFNDDLAAELGVDAAELDRSIAASILAGDVVPPGAEPVAMVYAGHQFGGYSPRLGDGRAVLLGEIVDSAGVRQDLHLKGSGRTPLSRGGDGKAALGPMLREYLIAEAMHTLGIPTTRALAVATTGEQIPRDGMVPGAVLTRVATSHLRVGTFEYSARVGDPDAFRRLVDYAVERHDPELMRLEGGERYLAFFDAVLERQASLIAQWMLVGFIHGVMNTDNMTVSGQGIDYGPCAFMDHFDSATVYSSIDHQGRYAYGNQPRIATWNLTRLAETLVSLIDDDFDAAAEMLTERLNGFGSRFQAHWVPGMRAKLGLVDPVDDPDPDADVEFLDQFVNLLQSQALDYTGTFRALAQWLRNDTTEVFEESDAAQAWLTQWRERVESQDRTPSETADAMDAVNPIYIPRNHLVEEALQAATDGDLAPFEQLLDVVTAPFVKRDGLDRFAQPAPPGFEQGYKTFCGT